MAQENPGPSTGSRRRLGKSRKPVDPPDGPVWPPDEIPGAAASAPPVPDGPVSRKVVRLPIGDFVANPRNARRHPQKQIDMVVASYRKFGQTRPLLARAANYMIIVGHGLWTAMKQAGAVEIDAILWDIDQKTADAYMVADNRLGDLSKDDPDLLGPLIRGADVNDLFAMGFDKADLDAAFGNIEQIGIHEVDASLVEDRFWISVKGRLRDQAKALDLLRTVFAEMPEIDVELGTVNLD